MAKSSNQHASKTGPSTSKKSAAASALIQAHVKGGKLTARQAERAVKTYLAERHG